MTYPDAMPPASVPLHIQPDEVMTVTAAAAHAGKCEKTIRRWIADYGIARQSMRKAPHQVSRIALDMVIHGDWPALERLRAGDRNHRLVQWYRQFAGLPAENKIENVGYGVQWRAMVSNG
jgi:hypothetical protein